MPFDDHKNFSYSLVATAPAPAISGTSLVVTGGTGTRFPTPPFNATIWATGALALPTNAEIVRVTAVSTDTLTITRAQEATSARTIVVGDQIAATVTDKVLTDIEAVLATPPLAVLGSDVSLATVTNTITETTVYSATLAAGVLGTTGIVHIDFLGDAINPDAVAQGILVKLKYGGQSIGHWYQGTFTSHADRRAVVGRAWIAAAGATGAQRGGGSLLIGAPGTAGPPFLAGPMSVDSNLVAVNNAATVDAASAQLLDLTVQWTVAHATTFFRLHTVHVVGG